MKALRQAYFTLNKQTFQVDGFSDSKISGHINVETPGNLLISIPKEAGWKIYVDGRLVESESFMDCLIEIPLSKGSHQIMMRYMTPEFSTGLLISIVCFGIYLHIHFARTDDTEKERLDSAFLLK